MRLSRNLAETRTKSPKPVWLGSFRFDPETHELRDAGGKTVELRRQSADVLAQLARVPERTVRKDALIDAIWGEVAVTDDSLVQCIGDIRRVLGPEARDCIQTVPRRGYRLIPTTGPAKPLWRRAWPPLALVATALILAAVLFATSRDGETENAAAGLPPARATVAVLPFTNMDPDPAQRYFSDGLTEDLTTDLSRFPRLRMISSASSFTYRDSGLSPGEIAGELGVTHYVTGSVRREGRRLRINVALAEADTGASLWANRYDRDIGGIFDLQDDVTRAIASALAVELTGDEEARFQRQQQIDPDAYDLLLRGLAPLRQFTGEGITEARAHFRRAIEIDPDYARAHANLALTYGQSIVFRLGDDPSSLSTALGLARKAVALDPTIPQARFALAVVHLSAGNHEAAIAAARESIRLDQSYADGYAVLAQTLGYGGDPKEALAAVRTAKVLSPRYTFAYLWVEAHILFRMRRYDEARALLEDVIERNPAFLSGYVLLAATCGHLGLNDDAEWLRAEILTISPGITAADEGRRVPYLKERDRDHLVEGLRLAGLPG